MSWSKPCSPTGVSVVCVCASMCVYVNANAQGSCWHHQKGTQLCVGGCKKQFVQFMLCTLSVVMQLCEHKEVVLFTLVLECSEQTLTHVLTYLFVHTNTFNKHSLTHIQCNADFLPCSDTVDREQCCRRSPGAQEGHRQVWLETDPSLRTACSNSGPKQLFVLDAGAWWTCSSIKI